MPRGKKADARMEDVKTKFLERAEELWDTHEEEFTGVLADAESKILNLSFTAMLDFSESTAKLKTTLRFSETITDRKEDDFDDPSQPRLPGTDEDGEPKRGKGKAKSKGRGKRAPLETSDAAEAMPG